MGKIRHIEVNQLWVQDKVANGKLKVIMIGTEENIADHITKYLSREGIETHMRWTNQWIEGGRHELMPAVAK